MKFNFLLRANSGWPIFLGVFFYQFMSGFDYQLIDLIENLRCEKTQVILDRLPVVRRFVLPGKGPPDLHVRASAGCCRDG